MSHSSGQVEFAAKKVEQKKIESGEYQRCTKCGVVKHVDEFSWRHPGVKRNSECVDCLRESTEEYQKEYRKENAEEIKEYRKKNAEKIKEQKKEYRKKNAEKIKERQKEYWRENVPYDYMKQIAYADKIRRDSDNYNLGQTKCTYCGRWCNPSRQEVYNRSQSLNGQVSGECRIYCREQCKTACPIYHQKIYFKDQDKPGSPREVQPELRIMTFERDNRICMACGKNQDELSELNLALHCHHITGVKLNPYESADVDNCVTLCEEHHREAHTYKGYTTHNFQCNPENMLIEDINDVNRKMRITWSYILSDLRKEYLN